MDHFLLGSVSDWELKKGWDGVREEDMIWIEH